MTGSGRYLVPVGFLPDDGREVDRLVCRFRHRATAAKVPGGQCRPSQPAPGVEEKSLPIAGMYAVAVQEKRFFHRRMAVVSPGPSGVDRLQQHTSLAVVHGVAYRDQWRRRGICAGLLGVGELSFAGPGRRPVRTVRVLSIPRTRTCQGLPNFMGIVPGQPHSPSRPNSKPRTPAVTGCGLTSVVQMYLKRSRKENMSETGDILRWIVKRLIQGDGVDPFADAVRPGVPRHSRRPTASRPARRPGDYTPGEFAIPGLIAVWTTLGSHGRSSGPLARITWNRLRNSTG